MSICWRTTLLTNAHVPAGFAPQVPAETAHRHRDTFEPIGRGGGHFSPDKDRQSNTREIQTLLYTLSHVVRGFFLHEDRSAWFKDSHEVLRFKETKQTVDPQAFSSMPLNMETHVLCANSCVE